MSTSNRIDATTKSTPAETPLAVITQTPPIVQQPPIVRSPISITSKAVTATDTLSSSETLSFSTPAFSIPRNNLAPLSEQAPNSSNSFNAEFLFGISAFVIAILIIFVYWKNKRLIEVVSVLKRRSKTLQGDEMEVQSKSKGSGHRYVEEKKIRPVQHISYPLQIQYDLENETSSSEQSSDSEPDLAERAKNDVAIKIDHIAVDQIEPENDASQMSILDIESVISDQGYDPLPNLTEEVEISSVSVGSLRSKEMIADEEQQNASNPETQYYGPVEDFQVKTKEY